MATRVEITMVGTGRVRLHVTDDTGRDDWAEAPCYPDPRSAGYVKLVDTLDSLMHEYAVPKVEKEAEEH